MKHRFTIIAPLVFVFVVTGGYFWFKNALSAVNPGQTAQTEFIISPSEPASVVVAKLSAAHLIKNTWATKLYLRLTESDARLLPGSYLVSPSQTTPDLFKSLMLGPKDVWVTIPEGWRREQIAARLAKTLGTASAFDPKEFLQKTASMEGRLFPDTYLIPAYATTGDVLKIITDNFAAKVPTVTETDLILASLVEREARVAPDRPIIAGIFIKRLDAGWPLQVDATIQYSEGSSRCRATILDCNWWQPPTDTTLDSLYNTYTHPGLPPTPIANPGLASIEAVLHPQTTSYWYYLTGADGVTHFAATLTEHNLNIDKYLHP